MKDECEGKQIVEFVGLRSKLYAYKKDNDEEEKKCKGIKKYIIKNEITFNDYVECLKTRNKQHRSMNTIRSRKHNIYTETINKIALSGENDKRVILDNGIQTLAIGHWRYLEKQNVVLPKRTNYPSKRTLAELALKAMR